MLITIITSTYNAAGTLQTCIDSVANQTYSDIEHIIIDGASKDGTPELIKQNAEREGGRITYWLSEPDSGIYDAWNKALPHIKGGWVLFLGADDWLHDRESISRMAPHLENAYPRYIVVYGKVSLKAKTSENDRVWGEPWDNIREDFGYKMQILHPSTFHHRTIFEKNRFDISYKISGDFEFLTRVILGGNADKVKFVDSIVTLMNVGGISSAPSLNRLNEDRRIAAKNGYHSPFWYPYYMSARGHFFGFIMSNLRGKCYDFARKIWHKFFRKAVLSTDELKKRDV